MSNNPITLVMYWIPEDHDDLETPNAFAIPKALKDITLVDIREHFPLSVMGREDKLNFHFSFKFKYNNGPVWFDLG